MLYFPNFGKIQKTEFFPKLNKFKDIFSIYNLQRYILSKKYKIDDDMSEHIMKTKFKTKQNKNKQKIILILLKRAK